MIDLSANEASSKCFRFEDCFNEKEELFCPWSVSKDEIPHGAEGRELGMEMGLKVENESG